MSNSGEKQMSKTSYVDPQCLDCHNLDPDDERCLLGHPIMEAELTGPRAAGERCRDLAALLPEKPQERLGQLIEELRGLKRINVESIGSVVLWADVEKLIHCSLDTTDRKPEQNWCPWPGDYCSTCGADVEVFTTSKGGAAYVGDPARCSECGLKGKVDVDDLDQHPFGYVSWDEGEG